MTITVFPTQLAWINISRGFIFELLGSFPCERRLAQPEIDANREVDRHRPPVLKRRLVLPLLDGLDGRIVEHGIRRAELGHFVDVAFLVDDRLEDDLAFDARAP